MSPRNHIQIQFDLATEDQAAELRAAWEEIVSGKPVRLETAAVELDEIRERARTALQRIVKAIEDHPGSGQARRLVSFLAGVYNGSEYPFDLTDLRVLDTDRANACIDYLNYDRLAKAAVHTHLPGRGGQIQRLYALSKRVDREPDALLKEALGDLLARYEGKAFGGLLATQPSPDGDRPWVHARLSSESIVKPLCGATDGPWSARVIEFLRVTCRDCRSLMLHPEDAPV